MQPDDLYDIDIQLQTCIDIYESQLTEFWTRQLEGEEWSELSQLRRDAQEIASALRQRAFALQNIGDTSTLNGIYQIGRAEQDAAEERLKRIADELQAKLRTDDARTLLDNLKPLVMRNAEPEEATDRPLHLVWQHLCIEDARETADGIRDRVRRVFELEDMTRQLRRESSLPQATVEFLALVGRTFVWGFDAECVILCRGAIDTAFRDKVPVRLIESRRQRAKNKEFGLADRIDAAFPSLISKEIMRAAEAVKVRGDKAIHLNPHATADVIGTVRYALQVIDCLAGLPDAPGATDERTE